VLVPACLAVGCLALPSGAFGATAAVSEGTLNFVAEAGEVNNVQVAATTDPSVFRSRTSGSSTPLQS
jgi:hypothetical protein